ncbi:MAG: phosphoribosyltransferase family protein [Patescibacteria group bacterium]
MVNAGLKAIVDMLFPPHRDVVVAHSVSKETLKPLFVLSLRSESSVYTGLPYAHEGVRALIKANKYYRDAHSSSVLALILRDMICDIERTREKKSDKNIPLLVPVPTAPTRARRRGAHQVKRILEALPSDIKNTYQYADVLSRHDRPSQTKVPKNKRADNIAGAFFVPVHLHSTVRGQTIFLIDDVTESGATLGDATRALFEAGATDIIRVALAK